MSARLAAFHSPEASILARVGETVPRSASPRACGGDTSRPSRHCTGGDGACIPGSRPQIFLIAVRAQGKGRASWAPGSVTAWLQVRQATTNCVGICNYGNCVGGVVGRSSGDGAMLGEVGRRAPEIVKV